MQQAYLGLKNNTMPIPTRGRKKIDDIGTFLPKPGKKRKKKKNKTNHISAWAKQNLSFHISTLDSLPRLLLLSKLEAGLTQKAMHSSATDLQAKYSNAFLLPPSAS